MEHWAKCVNNTLSHTVQYIISQLEFTIVSGRNNYSDNYVMEIVSKVSVKRCI